MGESRPIESGGATSRRDLLGHLPRGLVDHLPFEHDCSETSSLGLHQGVENPLGPVVLDLRGRIDPVARLNLVGVQRPLSIEAKVS